MTITNKSFEKEFTVSHFVRDALMNPAIIHSKRFLVNDTDFELVKRNIGEIEYLVQFQLSDIRKLNEFHQGYLASSLPKQGY